MNIDFSARPGFSAYVLLLMFAGVVMFVLGTPILSGRASRGRRIVSAAFGIGFFGYGFYLAFLFNGGHYVIFFQAFIVPILLVVAALRPGMNRRRLATPNQPGFAAGSFAPPASAPPTPPPPEMPPWPTPYPSAAPATGTSVQEWAAPPPDGQ
jgi:hypothetical protein